MIENLGYSQLASFTGTPGWGALTASEQSLFKAYLRRDETWTITDFLRAIGREAAIAADALRPPPAPAAAGPIPIPPGPGPVPIPYPIFDGPPAAPAAFDPTDGIVPPSHEELAAMRETADREFKRKQRQLSSAGQEAGASGAIVTLTAQEIQTATMLGRQWSAANSGHGRAAHGSYASGSSSHTAERDRQRSEQAAVQREIDKALRRKRKTGNAFAI